MDPTGTITTFAGTAHAPDTFALGDEGPASQALLTYVHSMAVDPSGAVFIAQDNQVQEFLTGPSITSNPSTTFTVGVAETFRVFAAGLPPPVIVESGTVPAGVVLTRGSGMLTISGRPGYERHVPDHVPAGGPIRRWNDAGVHADGLIRRCSPIR